MFIDFSRFSEERNAVLCPVEELCAAYTNADVDGLAQILSAMEDRGDLLISLVFDELARKPNDIHQGATFEREFAKNYLSFVQSIFRVNSNVETLDRVIDYTASSLVDLSAPGQALIGVKQIVRNVNISAEKKSRLIAALALVFTSLGSQVDKKFLHRMMVTVNKASPNGILEDRLEQLKLNNSIGNLRKAVRDYSRSSEKTTGVDPKPR